MRFHLLPTGPYFFTSPGQVVAMDPRDHPLWCNFVKCSQKHRHHAFVVGHASLFVTQRKAEQQLLVLPWARYFQTLAECPEGTAEESPLDVTIMHPCNTLSEARALLLQGARHGGRWAWVQPPAVWKAFLSGLPQPQEQLQAVLERSGLRRLLQAEARPLPQTPEPLPMSAAAEPLLAEDAEVTVFMHGRQPRSEALHRELRDLRCHATVQQQAPELAPVATTRSPPGLPFPATPDLLAEGLRQAPEHRLYLEALHAARPGSASFPPDLLPAANACKQQLRELAQEAAVLAQLSDPPMLLACIRLEHSVPVLPAGLLRTHTPELYPPISAPCAWETLADWLQRQEAEAPVLLLLLFLYQRHDPEHRRQCLAMAQLVMGAPLLAPFVYPHDKPGKVCAPDASWVRIRTMQMRLIVHLQQKGIVYLIRPQQEGEMPCCRPAKIPLTIELEEPLPPPLLPSPPPPELASYLPPFVALPDDTTLLFTPHGFTVKRLDGLPGEALQALWVYVNRELHKIRPGIVPPQPAEVPVQHRSSCTELMHMYETEEARQRQLHALQRQADAQLRCTALAFLDAFESYQETCTELRGQQELLAQMYDKYVLSPQQPFCHQSSLLACLQSKMQWQQWFVRHEGGLACMPYAGQQQLHRWYVQAHMCQVTEESQSLRTVTHHPDGTTVQHEAHSHRRSLQWKTQMLPELLQISQELEDHYCGHQFRIDWMEYLLSSLHGLHRLLEQELHAHKVLVSQAA